MNRGGDRGGAAAKRRRLRSFGVAGAVAILGLPSFLSASAQDIIAYPQRGQTQEQQQRDRFDCYEWAVGQTGFDPQRQGMAMQQAPAPPPQGGAFRGAARGAAVGAVGGAIGGDAGKGAAVGAGVGGVFGAMRRRDEQAQQYQMQSQQAAAISQQRSYFNRAMAACMQGRGYAVN